MELQSGDVLAMVRMLDDPDPKVYRELVSSLRSCGEGALPVLEEQALAHADGIIAQRLDEVMELLRRDMLCSFLVQWLKGEQNLLKAWFELTRYHHPFLDEHAVLRRIDGIARDIWMELNPNLTVFEQVRVFNHVFYKNHGFRGTGSTPPGADHFMIHRVLTDGVGHSLSLGILYMEIARRVDITLSGIMLPIHFVLAHMGEGRSVFANPEGSEPLFYIDVSHGGRVFSSGEIRTVLESAQMSAKPRFFQPCSKTDLIMSFLGTLAAAHHTEGNTRFSLGLEALAADLTQKSL